MYTDIRTILRDAAEKGYGVIATSAINMETARGIVAAATEKNAPIIFLLGQNMMRSHAKAELMIPMIQKLAEYKSNIEALQAEIKADEEKAGLLKMIGTKSADDPTEKKAARTLGDHFVEAVKSANVDKRFDVSASAKSTM